MASTPPAPSCVTCDRPLTGLFCASCGEKQLESKDERLGTFLKEQLQEFFSADGKLLRTFKALFVPGKLTTQYLAGRRGLYVRPIRIFLFVNLALFLTLRGSDGSVLKGPLASHFHAFLYGNLAERLADARAATWPGGPDSFAAAFNQRAAALAPTLIVILVPALALVLMLNRPRGPGVRHLVLATHMVATLIAFASILLVTLSAMLRLAVSLGWLSPEVDSIDPLLIPLVVLLYVAYFIGALRAVYGLPRWAAFLSGVATGTLGFAFTFWVYRAALFSATLWAL